MENQDNENQLKHQSDRFRQEQRIAEDRQAEELQRTEERGRTESAAQEQRRRDEDSRRDDQRRQDDRRRDDQRRQDDSRRQEQRSQDDRRRQEDGLRRTEQQRQESSRRQESQNREQNKTTEIQTHEKAARTLYEKSKENELTQQSRNKGTAYTHKPDQVEPNNREISNARARYFPEQDKAQNAERTQPGKTIVVQEKGQTERPSSDMMASLQTRVLNDETRKAHAEFNTRDRGDIKDKPATKPDKAQTAERTHPGKVNAAPEAKQDTRDRSSAATAAPDQVKKNESPAMVKYKEHRQATREKAQARIESQSQGQALSRGR